MPSQDETWGIGFLRLASKPIAIDKNLGMWDRNRHLMQFERWCEIEAVRQHTEDHGHDPGLCEVILKIQIALLHMGHMGQ